MEVSTGSLKVTTSAVESTVEVALRITAGAVSVEATAAVVARKLLFRSVSVPAVYVTVGLCPVSSTASSKVM